MELKHIDLSCLSVSPGNMRGVTKQPDLTNILPTVRTRGILVPLIVRAESCPEPVGPEATEGQRGSPTTYEIVAGKGRYHAALAVTQESGSVEALPCAVMEAGNEAAALEASLIENIARLDPDEMTRWESFTRLVRERRETLRELFARMTFNILAGNTDYHARNHAALWDGKALILTPAYDICPQAPNGRELNQAMSVIGQVRRSLLETCRLSAPSFLLSDANARTIVNEHAGAIIANWGEVCDDAGLAEVDRAFLWRRQILNDYVFEGYADGTPAGL